MQFLNLERFVLKTVFFLYIFDIRTTTGDKFVARLFLVC